MSSSMAATQHTCRTCAHNASVAGGGRLLRLKEAAAYLSVSAWTMRQMARRGEVAFIQRTPYSPFLFDLSDLDSWIESHKQGPGFVN